MSDNSAMHQTEPSAPNPAQKSVKRGFSLVLLLIILTLIWYLLGDRFTPYTQQARVQGFVVGVAPKVGGVVTRIWIHNDQWVKKGQKLFEIDQDTYRIAVEKARSSLQQAQSQLAAKKSAVTTKRASLRAAQANALKARQDSERQERLYKEDPGAVSIRRLEVARASLEMAYAKVASAESEVQRALENQQTAEEQIQVLRAQLEKAELDLSNTVVVSPIDGVVTDLRADVGLYAGAGQPVMTLVASREIWINAEFTENNLEHMQAGDLVDVVLDVLPGRVFKAEVRSIGRGVSWGRPTPPGQLPIIQNNRDWLRQSQRFPVVLVFKAEDLDQIKEHIRFGGQAEVMVYTRDAHILKILGAWFMRFMSWMSYAY